AELIRSAETGRVYVTYEVRDEPGPELSEDEARKALSLESSGAPGEASADDGPDDGTETEEVAGAPPDGADPPDIVATAYGRPPPGEPVAASRLRLSPPGVYKNLPNTDSVNTESHNGVRAFAEVYGQWPADHILSRVTAEGAYEALNRKDKLDCDVG